MKSTLVEFLRFQDLETGMLRKGDNYILVAGDRGAQSREMPIHQRPFNKLMRALRYEESEEKRQQALEEIERHTSYLLSLDKQKPDRLGLDPAATRLQQLDLVVNAAELAGLPFEAAEEPGGKLLFQSGAGIVLTRRVRGEFESSRPDWPIRPRILFVWSDAGGDVPAEEHRSALLDAVGPFLPARAEDRHKVFVEAGKASVKDIEEACTEGPFSHVHLLAHGHAVKSDEDDRFGIALQGNNVTPEELAVAFAPLTTSAVVFTLAACDAGNEQDSITPEKSLAHALHASGLPVVIASQLPLTVPGSNLLVRGFYRDVFAGKDVRSALHNARVALHEQRDVAGHDWVSLVGYVRLREGYEDHLQDVRLRSQLAALSNLRDRTEALGAGVEPKQVARIQKQLEGKIAELKDLLGRTHGDQDALDENLGLLGSGEKRLAELLFHQVGDEAASREALVRSRGWYRQAFERNPSHHWSGVQYLVLEAALEGAIDAKHWATAYHAAAVDRQKPSEYWAQGSLAELALLAPLADGKMDDTADDCLAEMGARVDALDEPPEYDPRQSTKLQLQRYVQWWRADCGFFGGNPEPCAEAQRLLDLLPD